MDWLRIVGTSHIASEASRRVELAFKEFSPDVVAVELDSQRLHGLLQGERPNNSVRMIRVVGLRGYLFVLLGSWLQRRLGRMVNMVPGEDMLSAVRLARHEGKRLLLIDRDIRVTLRRLNKALGWQEVKATVKELFRGRKERLSIRLDRVPSEELVTRLLREFKRQYPRLYKVLVEERNQHMAHALVRFHEQFPEEKLLLVIGIGHQEGIEHLLEQGV